MENTCADFEEKIVKYISEIEEELNILDEDKIKDHHVNNYNKMKNGKYINSRTKNNEIKTFIDSYVANNTVPKNYMGHCFTKTPNPLEDIIGGKKRKTFKKRKAKKSKAKKSKRKIKKSKRKTKRKSKRKSKRKN